MNTYRRTLIVHLFGPGFDVKVSVKGYSDEVSYQRGPRSYIRRDTAKPESLIIRYLAHSNPNVCF
jgi:hypothetical protein